jgi:hypothetical protein
MITPTLSQIKVAVTIIRSELNAISAGGFINYNDELPDEQLIQIVKKVLTGVLNTVNDAKENGK